MKTKLLTTFALCALFATSVIGQTAYVNCPLKKDVKDVNKKLNFTASASGITFTTDAIRDSIAVFDGTAGYITCDAAKIYDFAALTYNLWFEWTTSVPLQWWVRLWDFGWNSTSNPSGNNHDVNFMTLFQDGLLKWHIHPRSWTNGIDTILASKDTIKLNKWYMITVTHDKDSAKLYLNGVLNDKKAVNGIAPSAFDSLVNCYIGKSNWPDPLFTGKMQNFAIYNSVLTQSEVTDLYNSSYMTAVEFANTSMTTIYSHGSNLRVSVPQAKNASITIYNLQGQTILIKNNVSENTEINNLKTGLYVVKVVNANQVTSQKVVIR